MCGYRFTNNLVMPTIFLICPFMPLSCPFRSRSLMPRLPTCRVYLKPLSKKLLRFGPQNSWGALMVQKLVNEQSHCRWAKTAPIKILSNWIITPPNVAKKLFHRPKVEAPSTISSADTQPATSSAESWSRLRLDLWNFPKDILIQVCCAIIFMCV